MGYHFIGSIVTDGLEMCLDSKLTKSWTDTSPSPADGTVWRCLVNPKYNATLYNRAGEELKFNVPERYLDFTASNTLGGISGSTRLQLNSGFPVPTTGGFSIEAWINRDHNIVTAGNRESIFSNTGGGDGFRFQIHSNGHLYALVGSSSGYNEGDFAAVEHNLGDGRWHHVCVVFDRAGVVESSMRGYVDGRYVGSVAITKPNDPLSTATAGVSMGCCAPYGGKIARICVYSRLLAPIEVQSNYNALKRRFGA